MENIFQIEDKHEDEIVDNNKFNKFYASNQNGIKIVTEKYNKNICLKEESGNFYKWVNNFYPQINIQTEKSDSKLMLRNNDIWMPLVFLASDIQLPIYLNLVSNYVYDKIKGFLKNDKNSVHLEAIYQDEKRGITRKFKYSGSVEGLQKAIKKIDVNKIIDTNV